MTDQIQISIDCGVHDRLLMLMVPPISDANAVIKELLYLDGRAGPSRAAIALEASEQHFTPAQELERSNRGVYDSAGP